MIVAATVISSPKCQPETDCMDGRSHIDERPRFQRLADYLARKAPPGKLPGRQHVEPTEIVELLPWIMLIDVISGER
jgi:hypothetical protein